MNEVTKGRLAFWFRLVCIVSTVVALWWMLRELDFAKLGDTFERADVWLLVLAVALNLAAQLVRAVSWTAMLGPRHPVGFGPLLRYELAAQAASSISPARAGELLRLWMLKREDVPATVTTALIVLKKAIGALCIAVIALSALFLPGLPGWVPAFVVGITALMAVQLVLLVWAAYRAKPEKVPKFLRGVVDGMYFLRDRRSFSLSTFVIFLGEALDALAAFAVMHALHIELSLLAAALVVFFIDFSNALPAAPGHLGTFEVGALYSLGFLGVGQDAAFAFALLFHAQQALPQIVVGLPFQLHFLSTKKKQAQVIGQESS